MSGAKSNSVEVLTDRLLKNPDLKLDTLIRQEKKPKNLYVLFDVIKLDPREEFKNESAYHSILKLLSEKALEMVGVNTGVKQDLGLLIEDIESAIGPVHNIDSSIDSVVSTKPAEDELGHVQDSESVEGEEGSRGAQGVEGVQGMEGMEEMPEQSSTGGDSDAEPKSILGKATKGIMKLPTSAKVALAIGVAALLTLPTKIRGLVRAIAAGTGALALYQWGKGGFKIPEWLKNRFTFLDVYKFKKYAAAINAHAVAIGLAVPGSALTATVISHVRNKTVESLKSTSSENFVQHAVVSHLPNWMQFFMGGLPADYAEQIKRLQWYLHAFTKGSAQEKNELIRSDNTVYDALCILESRNFPKPEASKQQVQKNEELDEEADKFILLSGKVESGDVKPEEKEQYIERLNEFEQMLLRIKQEGVELASIASFVKLLDDWWSGMSPEDKALHQWTQDDYENLKNSFLEDSGKVLTEEVDYVLGMVRKAKSGKKITPEEYEYLRTSYQQIVENVKKVDSNNDAPDENWYEIGWNLLWNFGGSTLQYAIWPGGLVIGTAFVCEKVLSKIPGLRRVGGEVRSLRTAPFRAPRLIRFPGPKSLVGAMQNDFLHLLADGKSPAEMKKIMYGKWVDVGGLFRKKFGKKARALEMSQDKSWHSFFQRRSRLEVKNTWDQISSYCTGSNKALPDFVFDSKVYPLLTRGVLSEGELARAVLLKNKHVSAFLTTASDDEIARLKPLLRSRQSSLQLNRVQSVDEVRMLCSSQPSRGAAAAATASAGRAGARATGEVGEVTLRSATGADEVVDATLVRDIPPAEEVAPHVPTRYHSELVPGGGAVVDELRLDASLASHRQLANAIAECPNKQALLRAIGEADSGFKLALSSSADFRDLLLDGIRGGEAANPQAFIVALQSKIPSSVAEAASGTLIQSAQRLLRLNPESNPLHSDFLARLQKSTNTQEIVNLCSQRGEMVTEAIMRNPEWRALVDENPNRLLGALQRFSVTDDLPDLYMIDHHIAQTEDALRMSFRVYDQELESLAEQLKKLGYLESEGYHRNLLHKIMQSDNSRAYFAVIEDRGWEWVAREISRPGGENRVVDFAVEIAGRHRRTLAQGILGTVSPEQWKAIQVVHESPLKYPDYPKTHNGSLHPDDVGARHRMLRNGVDIGDGKPPVEFDSDKAGQLIAQKVCGSDDPGELVEILQRRGQSDDLARLSGGLAAGTVDEAASVAARSDEVADLVKRGLPEEAATKLDDILRAKPDISPYLVPRLTDMEPGKAARLINTVHDAVDTEADIVRFAGSGGDLSEVSDFARTAKAAGKWAAAFKALDVGGVTFDAFFLAYTAHEWNETTKLIANTENNEALREKYKQRRYFLAAEAAISGTGLVAGGAILAGAGGTIATPVILATVPVSVVVGMGYAWHKWEEGNARTAEDWAREYGEQELLGMASEFSLGEKVGATMSMHFGDRSTFEKFLSFAQLTASPGGAVGGLMSPRGGEDMKRVGQEVADQLAKQVRAIVEKTSIVKIPVVINVKKKDGTVEKNVSVNDPDKSEEAKKMFEIYGEAVKRYYEAKIHYLAKFGRGESGAVFGDNAPGNLFAMAEAYGRLAHDRYVASLKEDADVPAYFPKEDDPTENQANAYRDILWGKQASALISIPAAARSSGESVNERGEKVLLSAKTSKLLSDETQSMLFAYCGRIRTQNYTAGWIDPAEAAKLLEPYVRARYDVYMSQENEKIVKCIQENASAFVGVENPSPEKVQKASQNIEQQLSASIARVSSIFGQSPKKLWHSLSELERQRVRIYNYKHGELMKKYAEMQGIESRLRHTHFVLEKKNLEKQRRELQAESEELLESLESYKWGKFGEGQAPHEKVKTKEEVLEEEKSEKEKSPRYILMRNGVAKQILYEGNPVLMKLEERIANQDFPGVIAGQEKIAESYARFGAALLFESKIRELADGLTSKKARIDKEDYKDAVKKLGESTWSKNPVDYWKFGTKNRDGRIVLRSKTKNMLTYRHLWKRIDEWKD